ncbi:hypothetical protein OAL80_02230 [Pelagibacteraceae bacterium]|nr:hypothetical protein [Pelagibacteraceae bacterium]
MKKTITAYICFIIFSSSSFAQSAIEKKLLINFDGLCVQNINKLISIADFAKSNNWKQIPPGKDALVAPQVKGSLYQAYGFKDEGSILMIAINNAENTNTCSMASIYSDISYIKKTLNEFYQLKLVKNISQGIQTTEVYSANLIQSPKAMIVLTYGTQSNINVVSISVIKNL